MMQRVDHVVSTQGKNVGVPRLLPLLLSTCTSRGNTP
jgi:hypothetical protein